MPQICTLMLFDDTDALSVQQIAESLQIDVLKLLSILQGLIKAGVLKVADGAPEITTSSPPTSMILLNKAFSRYSQ